MLALYGLQRGLDYFREGEPTEGYKDVINGSGNPSCSLLEGIIRVFWVFQIHILYLDF